MGPKTAEKIKVAWEVAHGNTAALANRRGGTGAGAPAGTPGLRMPQLLESPPVLGFAWGPDTRCFAPHLHAAEQVVSQRSLQRAAAFRPASSRQLNRVRKWVAANQNSTGV